MKLLWVRALFLVCGVYDAGVGLAFLAGGPTLFDAAGVPHPKHWAYLQFAALLLVVFGVMFFAVAANPVANRNLIPFGMLLKVCYVGIVGFYWFTAGVPLLFLPFAGIDAVMLVLFVVAYWQLGRVRA